MSFKFQYGLCTYSNFVPFSSFAPFSSFLPFVTFPSKNQFRKTRIWRNKKYFFRAIRNLLRVKFSRIVLEGKCESANAIHNVTSPNQTSWRERWFFVPSQANLPKLRIVSDDKSQFRETRIYEFLEIRKSFGMKFSRMLYKRNSSAIPSHYLYFLLKRPGLNGTGELFSP